ncbi:hypothetical protein [Streptomyces inhibens]|uniref:hypothetical protein n=1 Tax=Streptomyces inhibens TaxID=2293571 RepID=UPI0015F2A062|nr:hypothetical protein [Streptomyces inhibens]
MTTRVPPHTPSPSPVLLGDAEVGERLDPATAVAAVADRDVVIVATNSPTPVVEANWIAPSTQLSTLGPKSTTHYEIPPEPAARAAVLVTGSPARAGSWISALSPARAPAPPVRPGSGRTAGRPAW